MDMLAPVVLLVTLKIEPDQILLHYSVENKSGAEIFLVNHLTRYEQDKGWIPDTKVVYAFFGDENVIELSKRVPPMPDDRLVTPRNYYVTPLPDGQRFEEDLAISLPLCEHRPYDSLIEPIPEPRDMDATLTFLLGYFESHPHIEAQEVEVHGVPAFRIARRKSVVEAGQYEPASQQSGTSEAPKEKILKSDTIKATLTVIPLPKQP